MPEGGQHGGRQPLGWSEEVGTQRLYFYDVYSDSTAD